MAKNSKRKKKGKSRKQQPATLALRPPIKISEAILNLCEPLRNKYREPHRIKVIVSMTVMAWNFSLFEEEEELDAQKMFLDTLPKDFDAGDVVVLLESIDTLIASKRRDYPDIREFILSYDLSFSGDMLTLSVRTAPVPETIQRKIA